MCTRGATIITDDWGWGMKTIVIHLRWYDACHLYWLDLVDIFWGSLVTKTKYLCMSHCSSLLLLLGGCLERGICCKK